MLKITKRSETENIHYFYELDVKDAFKTPHSTAIFMRMQTYIVEGEWNNVPVFNAINLNTGSWLLLDDMDAVIPVEAELKVED